MMVRSILFTYNRLTLISSQAFQYVNFVSNSNSLRTSLCFYIFSCDLLSVQLQQDHYSIALY